MTGKTDNLRDLVVRLQGADEQAFRVLYDIYHAKLYWYSLKFVRDEEVAAEMVQAVFVKVWEKKHTLNPDLPINAYLYALVKNGFINHYKKAAVVAAHVQETNYLTPEACTDTEDALEFGDYLSLAQLAIAKMPPQRQLIFRMSREQELSHQEIATTLGISKNTVKVQVVKALKFIRAYLGLKSDLLGVLIAYFTLR